MLLFKGAKHSKNSQIINGAFAPLDTSVAPADSGNTAGAGISTASPVSSSALLTIVIRQ